MIAAIQRPPECHQFRQFSCFEEPGASRVAARVASSAARRVRIAQRTDAAAGRRRLGVERSGWFIRPARAWQAPDAPFGAPSCGYSRARCRAGPGLALRRNSVWSVLARLPRAARSKRRQSESRGTVCAAGAGPRCPQEKHQRAHHHAAAVECQHRGAAGESAGTSATGLGRPILLVFRRSLEVPRCDPAKTGRIPATNGDRSGGCAGARWSKTRGNWSAAVGGTATLIPHAWRLRRSCSSRIATRSASTISLTSASKLVLWIQPSLLRALLASPSRESTSVGRK